MYSNKDVHKKLAKRLPCNTIYHCVGEKKKGTLSTPNNK